MGKTATFLLLFRRCREITARSRNSSGRGFYFALFCLVSFRFVLFCFCFCFVLFCFGAATPAGELQRSAAGEVDVGRLTESNGGSKPRTHSVNWATRCVCAFRAVPYPASTATAVFAPPVREAGGPVGRQVRGGPVAGVYQNYDVYIYQNIKHLCSGCAVVTGAALVSLWVRNRRRFESRPGRWP